MYTVQSLYSNWRAEKLSTHLASAFLLDSSNLSTIALIASIEMFVFKIFSNKTVLHNWKFNLLPLALYPLLHPVVIDKCLHASNANGERVKKYCVLAIASSAVLTPFIKSHFLNSYLRITALFTLSTTLAIISIAAHSYFANKLEEQKSS